MKKLFSVFFLFFIMLNAVGQNNKSKFDFKFGSGLDFIDINVGLYIENELNYKLNNYFSASTSLGVGRTLNQKYQNSNSIQGSLNAFISPFKNNRQNNLKLGVGLSIINVLRTQPEGGTWFSQIGSRNYDNRTNYGYNLILEDEYMINSRFLIGGKIFISNGFREGTAINGALLKVGVVL